MPLEPPAATPGRPITAPDQAPLEALELPSCEAVWPAAELAETLDLLLAAADRCLAELTARPPWW